MRRWILFTLMIVLGVGLVVLYAWYLSPPELEDTSPPLLRIDYKADYVLMVAEIYAQDNDIERAIQRISLLGDQPPLETVNLAIQFAETNGYKSADLTLLWDLRDSLQGLR